MEWLDTALIYTVTETSLNGALDRMFGILADVLNAFWVPVQAAAAVYIALMGYALMSGAISMPAREVAIRFAKVIGIIFLMRTFSIYGDDLFNRAWAIPDAISDFYAREIAPILEFPNLVGIGNMDALAGFYSVAAENLSQEVTSAHNNSQKWGFWTWVITMAPLALTVVSVFIAKFVAALLFLVSPIVFILSLTIGNFNNSNILMSWFKALAMTFITVIFIYIVGITCMAMMGRYIVALVAFDAVASSPILDIFGLGGALGAKYTLVHLAPLGIMTMFTIVLLSQATNVAGSIMGIAAISSQQMTSFAQISALNAAPTK